MFRIIIDTAESIFAMSRSVAEMKASLEDHTRPIIEHILKLYLYPNCSTTDHWKTEVYSAIHEVFRLKTNNKFPSPKFILDNTIKINESIIPAMYRQVKLEYQDESLAIRSGANVREAQNLVFEYFTWLADALQPTGKIIRKQVFLQLESMGIG